MKQIIRLTESDLHRLVKESARKILSEMDFGTAGFRNKVRQAFANKYDKIGNMPKHIDDPETGEKIYNPEREKAEKTISNVYKYMSKKRHDDNTPVLPGSEGVKYNNDMAISSYPEDYVFDEFGDEVGNAFMEWAKKVDFDPTQYGQAQYSDDDPSVGYIGGYDGTYYSEGEEDALIFELDKLDRDDCPLTPEQRDELRDSIVIDLYFGEMDNEWDENPHYERPDY